MKKAASRSLKKGTSPFQAYLMVYHTANEQDDEIGRAYEFSNFGKNITIGNREKANILVPSDEHFPYNARLYQDSTETWYLENLEEHNNIFVNGVLSRARKLYDGDLIHFGPVTFRFLDGKGKESIFYRGLQRVIGTDVLTGISNRRQLYEELAKAIAYCKRSDRPFCLVLIDFDNFSAINNTYGHAAGDVVLKEITARIRKNIRAEDIFGREGGEEFLLGLPNLTKEKAFAFLDRVKKKVTKDPVLLKNHYVRPTFSAGLAEWEPKMELSVLKELADELMYKAKRQGKNQVVMSEDESIVPSKKKNERARS